MKNKLNILTTLVLFVGFFYKGNCEIVGFLNRSDKNPTKENDHIERGFRNLSFIQFYGNENFEVAEFENFEIKVGDIIVLTAEPNPGYFFDYWEINGKKISEKQEFEYEMPDEDINVVGYFKKLAEPVIQIVSPVNNAVYEANTNFPVMFEAKSDNGRISKIELFRNDVFLVSVNDPNIVFNLNISQVGGSVLRAKATDDRGGVAFSPEVRIEIIPANVPPVVKIISPGNGEEFLEGTDVKLEAEAFDSDGSISKVEFYNNGSLIGSSTIAPYVFTLAKPYSGTYSITAKAYDNKGASTTSEPIIIKVKTNSLPQVNIVSPKNNDVFYEGTAINIKVEAFDTDGEIQKVEFYNNNVLIGVSNTFPFNIILDNALPGEMLITAKAFDDKGEYGVSSAIRIIIRKIIKISNIEIVTPIENQVFGANESIMISVRFSEGDGHVKRVEYYYGNQLIGSSNTKPFSYEWKNALPGEYTLRAVAIGGDPEMRNESGPIKIQIKNNPFEIVSPVNNARLIAGADLKIRITPPFSDKKIKHVEFFRGNQRIGISSTAPYEFIWKNIPRGEVNLVARLVFDDNSSILSKVVKVFGEDKPLPDISLSYQVFDPQVVGDNTKVQLNFSVKGFDFEIAEVEYFANGNPIGSSNIGPFGILWEDVMAGTYLISARITASNGLQLVSKEIVVQVLDVFDEKNEPKEISFIIGPNPTSDLLNIFFKDFESDEILKVNVVSMSGNFNKEFISNIIDSQVSIDLTDLRSGVYVLRMEIGKNILQSAKFIKK